MSETVVAKASPTLTATGPATGTAGTAIATGSQHHLGAHPLLGCQRLRHDHLHGLRAPDHAPPPPAQAGGTTVGKGDTVVGQRCLPPAGRLHARPRPVTTGGTPPTTGTPTTTPRPSTCGSDMTETVVPQGLPDPDGDRPGHRHGRHRHRDDRDRLGALAGTPARARPARSPSPSSGPRPGSDNVHKRGHHGRLRGHSLGQHHLPPRAPVLHSEARRRLLVVRLVRRRHQQQLAALDLRLGHVQDDRPQAQPPRSRRPPRPPAHRRAPLSAGVNRAQHWDTESGGSNAPA